MGGTIADYVAMCAVSNGTFAIPKKGYYFSRYNGTLLDGIGDDEVTFKYTGYNNAYRLTFHKSNTFKMRTGDIASTGVITWSDTDETRSFVANETLDVERNKALLLFK